MSKEDFTLYSSVTDKKKMKSVLEQLTHNGGKILVRSASGSVHLISDPGLSNGEALAVKTENIPIFAVSRRVSVWFDSSDGGYFFECLPRMENEKALLAPGDRLFHQQRRREVRFTVPTGYEVFFTVRIPDGEPKTLRLAVKDINESGIGFEIPQDFAMNADDTVSGTLEIGSHRAVQAAGKVRRRQMTQEHVYIGLEFNHGTHDSGAAIAERLLYMRHDVYYMKKTFPHKT